MKKWYWIILGILLIISIWAISPFGVFDLFNNQHKIDLNNEVVEEIEDEIEEKNIAYPILQTTLIIYKKEQLAAIWITDKQNQTHLIFSDSILLENNQNGTRLYDTETIIPEGVYAIKTIDSDELNLVIDFPNEYDIEKQQADKRPELISEILFSTSENQVQFSKTLMNEFLYLAKEANVENTQIIILPYDFENEDLTQSCLICPFWIEELYGSLRIYLRNFSQEIQ